MASVPASNVLPPAQKKVRVVKVVICEDRGCSLSSSHLSAHLSIEILDIPLQGRDQAVAISYTWGAFNRTTVPIGHLKNKVEAVKCMELGQEWDLPEFVSRLHALSAEHVYLWLDQLCIPQKTEAIRQALADVPDIYRTFDVFALMPGHPCKCLREFLNVSESEAGFGFELDQGSREARYLRIASRIAEHVQCLNFTATSSWWSRLWTRQELMYSQRIRCVWASTTEAQCVPQLFRNQDAMNLTPYLLAFRESVSAQDLSEEEVGLVLKKHVTKIISYGQAEMLAYAGTSASLTTFFDFLGGKTLENGRDLTDKSIYGFLANLQFLMQGLNTAKGTRAATQPRDYVVSVWVDCPEYRVPPEFREWPLWRLLQNAMDQLDAKHNRNLLTTAPRGLFASDTLGGRSACWDPEQYFASIHVQGLSDVYSPLFTSSPFFYSFAGGRLPFASVPGVALPLSAEVIDWDMYLRTILGSNGGHENLANLVRHLKGIVAVWAELSAIQVYVSSTFSDLHLEYRRPSNSPNPEVPDELLHASIMAALVPFASKPQENACKDAWAILDKTHWNVEHIKDALYRITALALGLSVDACRAEGREVRIMLSADGGNWDKMRLGLYRGDVELALMSCRALMDEVKSVKMNVHFSGKLDTRPGGDLIYEAVKVGEAPSSPAFEVFGVWVPLQDGNQGGWNAQVIEPSISGSEAPKILSGILW